MIWHAAAGALLIGIAPCLLVLLRGEFRDGLIALQLGGVLASLALLALAEAEERQPFADLAIVMAVASTVGSLVIVRYAERADSGGYTEELDEHG